MSDTPAVDLAPGRLSAILEGARSGHHPLFDLEEIRAAFVGPEVPVGRHNAEELGRALIAVARDPFAARGVLGALAHGLRSAFIRIYFRLLERAHRAPTLH